MAVEPITKGVRQIGLYAPDPGNLAGFYQAMLGLYIIGQGELNGDGCARVSCSTIDRAWISIR